MSSPGTTELRIEPDDAGQRLDRFLRKLLPNAPLGLIHRVLRRGGVRVDGVRVDAAHRLAAGCSLRLPFDAARFDELSGDRDGRRPPTSRATASTLDVVWADDDIWIVDKPGGLAVHGGTGTGGDHLAARIAARVAADAGASQARTFRPAPAHRLDRGTSGLVAVGRTAVGLRGLHAAFRTGAVEKHYVAVVAGHPDPSSATITAPLTVRDRGAGRAKTRPAGADDDGGVAATTHYTVRTTGRGRALLDVRIDTGRTHQIRAHLADRGHPIVGDRRYGGPEAARELAPRRFALHAARLVFPHPVTGERIDVEAAVPAELLALVGDRGRR